MDNGDIIRAGDVVIVRMHDDKSTSMLKVQGEQKICRSKVSTKQLVGAPYGSVFQITSDRKLQLVKDDEEDAILEASANEGLDENSSDSMIVGDVLPGDNRGYIDTNTAQKLSTDDIQRLRDSGASGKEIIQSLIANSDTWASKTEFAQEKWLKRKQKKYIRCMRIVKSCPSTVCEVYHTKNKEKICGLRWDSLAQLLSAGGIHSGSRVLVFDSVLGLAVGSVAYRLRGKGVVLAAYAGQQPHFEIVNSLNLDTESLAVIQTIPSEELGPAATHVRNLGFGVPMPPINDISVNSHSTSSDTLITHTDTDTNTSTSIIANSSKNESESVLSMPVTAPASSLLENNTTDTLIKEDVEMSINDNKSNDNNNERITVNDNVNLLSDPVSVSVPVPVIVPRVYPPSKPHHGSGRQTEPLNKLRDELRKGVDSLIIACKYDPLPILKTTLSLLVPSSPFVVYCEFSEPLVECYLYVTENALAVKVSLSDTWAREFQTLPGRVHPQMFMSTSSGYILSGVYIGVPSIYRKVAETNKINDMVLKENKSSDMTVGDDMTEMKNDVRFDEIVKSDDVVETREVSVAKRGRRR